MRAAFADRFAALSPARQALEALAQTFYPPLCLCCRKPLLLSYPAALCDDCLSGIRWHGESSCDKCGAAAGQFAELGRGCESCRKREFAFTRAVGATTYGLAAKALVHELKFYGNRRLAPFMAAAMATRLREAGLAEKEAVVAPVPLHEKRRRERGYNQSGLLAQGVAGLLGAPLESGLLQRVRHTEAQSSLNYSRRLANPVGAFACAADLAGKTIFLVDDVLTTGATVDACAQALRVAGARRIYVAVFAR